MIRHTTTDRWASLVRVKVAPGSLFLVLALILTIGSAVSWRYHFFFHNYAPFIVDQVLPRVQASDLEPKIINGDIERRNPGRPELDRFPFDTPYCFKTDPYYSTPLTPIGTDFLSTWFFLKTIREGNNPYRNDGPFYYNLGPTPVRDPTVPVQSVSTGMSYFPAAPWLVFPFSSANYLASLARYLVAFRLFLIAAGAFVVSRCGAHRATATMLMVALYFTCYPVDFLLDRGNIEGVVLMLVAGFYVAYLSGRPYHAAALLAAATAGKLFPLVLFVHFLFDRKYKPMLFGCLVLVAFTSMALLAIRAPIPLILSQLRENVAAQANLFPPGPEGHRFTYSLFAFLTAGLFPGTVVRHDPFVREMAGVYPAIAAMILGALLWVVRRADFEHRAIVVTAAMVFLPSQAAAYHLVHMLIPFALLVMKLARSEEVVARDALLAALIAALFVAKEYLVAMFGLEWGVAVLVNPPILMAIIALGAARAPQLAPRSA